jgi:hypothetical protein
MRDLHEIAVAKQTDGGVDGQPKRTIDGHRSEFSPQLIDIGDSQPRQREWPVVPACHT